MTKLSTLNQLEILKKYYPIDEEKKLVIINLYYDSAKDILDYSIGDEKCEMINEDVIEKIAQLTDKIPKNYKAKIIINIENYEGYDKKSLMSKLKDIIILDSFEVLHNRKARKIISYSLLLIGLIMLIILGIARIKWFKENIISSVIDEAIDIASWVFIWEAVSIRFLSPSDKMLRGIKLASKIESIELK